MASYINETQTIGVTSSKVLPDRTALNERRTAFIISNQSTGGQKITLSVSKEAALGAGIVLAVGGSWDLSANEIPPQAQINAISDIAGGTLSVYEEAK